MTTSQAASASPGDQTPSGTTTSGQNAASTAVAPRYGVVLHVVTAGLQGDALGSDEHDTVLLVWLILDLQQCKVVGLHVFPVKPRSVDANENFLLSDSCRAETGISDEFLKEAGLPVENAIEKFMQIVQTRLDTDGAGSYVIITDGQLHLRQALHPEAVRHNITLPDALFQFIDLRKCFTQFYATEPPQSVQEMLNYLTIEPDKSAEYVIRQIQDMGKIVLRLSADGHKFSDPEVIISRLEPGLCSKSEVVDSNTVVRARGLPWQSSDQDIAKFFRGLNIVKGGVALCLTAQGRRNGEALVRFVNVEHRDMALKRHKHHIGQRYIEVYRATGEDFINVAGGNSNEATEFLSRGGQVIVRMRGLPYDCTAKQIVEFFAQDEIPVLDGEDGIMFVKKPDGRATGDAFVLFADEDSAAKALSKHREVIGSRYIELFRSSTAEVQQVLNRTMDQRTYDTPALFTNIPQIPTLSLVPQQVLPAGSRKDCIRLRGLPYEAQVEHILEFLGEHAKNIVYQGVHMVYNAQGQPSGEAFIQMDSEQSACLTALQRHHRYMVFGKKQRYVEVFQCSVDDMNLVLTGGIPTATVAAALQRPLLSPGGTIIPTAAAASPYSAAAAYTAAVQAAAVQAASYAPQALLGPPPQGAQATALGPAVGAPRAPASATYYPSILYWPYPSPPVSPTTYYSPAAAAAAALSAGAAAPTMVIMRGLPYSATVSDILTFFAGFPELTADCIQITRNSDGRPNGEALVTFPTRLDAERALQEKNRQNIGNRYIELFMA